MVFWPYDFLVRVEQFTFSCPQGHLDCAKSPVETLGLLGA